MEDINNNLPESSQNIPIQEKSIESNKIEQPELSTEEQLKNLEGNIGDKKEEINKLTKSIDDTKGNLNEIRASLGLAPEENDPQSVLSGKDRLEKLQNEQRELDKQREEIITKQEKEKLIKQEKEKILQEKFSNLFKEFEKLNAQDFESIINTGIILNVGNFESRLIGKLNPENIKFLARIFKEGVKFSPEILKSMPEILNKLDEVLEKEAIENVDKKLEEEKKKMEESKKPEPESEPEPESKPDLESIKLGANIENTNNTTISNEISQETNSSSDITQNNQ